MRKNSLLIVFLIAFAALKAQVGGVAGTVTDAVTGRELIGVQVIIKPGNRTDYTDVEGRFLFSGLKPGIYSLELREVSHITTFIPVLRVSVNEITVITISMYDSVKALTGVIITAKKPRRDNAAGVAIERKSSPSIMDGISQEAIKRTPDRNTAESLRRISGITLQDNKFPVVRGLADRYNMSMLNGVPLPSTLPDKKAFSFDVIPSGLLDNILVVKSATPEQPGEFAGAVIRLNTRDVPDENIQTVTIGFGGYTNSIGRKAEWQTNKGGDAVGLGTGSRALPAGMPNSLDYMSLLKSERADYSKKLENDWGTVSRVITPGLQFQYSNSSRFLLGGKESGGLFAVSYSSLSRINDIDRNEYNTVGKTREYKDRQFTNNVLWGVLANFTTKLNKQNKLAWRNFFSNNTDEENNIREGTNFESGTFQKAYSLNYLQNYFFSTQLSGDHFFKKTGVKFTWTGGIQNVFRNTPDYRRLLYVRPSADPSLPLTAALTAGRSFENAGKMYTRMNENVQFGAWNFIKSIFKDNFKSDIKLGGFHQLKSREFSARILSVVEHGFSVPDSLKRLGPSLIFRPENMGGDGFRYDDIYDLSYTYTGNSALHAAYLMADNIIDRFFRITGGLRVEQFTQKMKTHRPGSIDPAVGAIQPEISNLNLLPSAGITLLVSNRTNIRFAYAGTVSRPDFREISPFSYFDFVNFVSVTGYDSLQSGTIQNFDFRYETFPGDGQSFSVGAFIKNFKNPIEQIVNPVMQDGNRMVTFRNAREAVVYGAEAEFRMKLQKLAATLRSFQAYGNASVIFSEVNVNGNVRPLQGQAPYMANVGLQYNSRRTGYSFSVNYNVVGPRMTAVGTVNYPDFYLKARNVLDVQLAKSFGRRAELKLNLGDLLAQNYVLYQNKDSKQSYSGKDLVVNRMKTAPMVITSFTYRIN
ncbi:MAG: TonB-dependent receptor [Bacteroidetes bacterium]|nr:TonB-dependent receptor [Bacteroidota bacterium]